MSEQNHSAKVILCIDDDPISLAMLGRSLRKLRHQVVTADTPFEGLELVHDLNPDLILLDFMMPDMDGKQVLSKVRETHADLPVVFLTGRIEDSVVDEVMAAGASGCLRKPFDVSELRDLVQRLLGETDGEPEPAPTAHVQTGGE